jgi:hypothetical protein
MEYFYAAKLAITSPFIFTILFLDRRPCHNCYQIFNMPTIANAQYLLKDGIEATAVRKPNFFIIGAPKLRHNVTSDMAQRTFECVHVCGKRAAFLQYRRPSVHQYT